MLNQPGPITLNNILFATDFSPASEAGFAYATSVADRYHSVLYVAHVINLEPFDLIATELTPEMMKRAREQARQKMDELLGARQLQGNRFRPIVAEGGVAEMLLDILHRNNIDLAVVGTHGRRAFKKLLLGSIAEEVFRMAPCPVLTMGPRVGPPVAKAELRHILYAVEFAPDSSEAAKYAVSLAEQYGANLTVMNVREDMPASANKEEQINEPAERWLEDHVAPGSDLRNRVHLERGFGPAPAAILDFATKAPVDVIVMSVRRLDPVMAAHLPKPDTAYEVVSRAPCPVLTVR
jgi:nucleotide-binding universal stress UspA family protein